MNIALNSFYLPSVDKIGVGYQAHYLANALVKRGHRVVMFSPVTRCEDADYEHRQVDVGLLFRLHGFAWAMRKQNLREFDVLHSHGEDHFIFGRRMPWHVRTMHGSCLHEAINIRGLKSKIRMLYIACTEIVASRVADRTVAVSVNTTRSYPWIKRVIPNGVNLSAFCAGKKELTPTILFVGTYQNRKRGKWLMKVFEKQVRLRVPGVKMWMVCSDAPAARGVEVLGKLSTQELADRYRRAWVFCLPSTYEGFGVPYIEAMASGTAVVASPNPGANEVLEEGRWGVICPDDVLAEELVTLLSDASRRKTMEIAGLERARAFSWDTVCSQYEQLYKSKNEKSF